MPTHPDELQVLSTAVTRMDGRVTGLETGVAGMSSKLDSLTAIVNAGQRTNWPVITGFAVLIISMSGAIWKVVELQNMVALAPLQAQDSVSTVERKENREDIARLLEVMSGEVAARKSGFAALQQQLVENESQQRFGDSVRTLLYQHLEGYLRMLAEHVKFPAPSPITHHPEIGRSINIPIPNE